MRNNNLNKVLLSILGAITIANCSDATAMDYYNTVDTGNTELVDGDQVLIVGNNPETIGVFSDSTPINIGDGKVLIDVNTNGAGARGIDISNATANNLGNGTTIYVTEHNTFDTGSAIGINLTNDSSINANRIHIEVDGINQSIGISSSGENDKIDLGTDSSISSISDGLSSGIYLGMADLNANAINISSTGEFSNGITVVGGDSKNINLGSDSKIYIKASGGGSDISIDGSKGFTLSANQIQLGTLGNNSHGISVDNTDESSTINLGYDSSIGINGKYGSGILFGENAQSSLTASGLSIVTLGLGTTGIKLNNGKVELNDSYIRSYDSTGVILTSGSSSQTPVFNDNGGTIIGKQDGIDVSGAGSNAYLHSTTVASDTGYALKADNGGNINTTDLRAEGMTTLYAQTGSNITFSGNSIIHSDLENAIVAENTGTTINGSGSASIDGNILAKDMSSINLDLIAGSVINGTANKDESSAIDISLSEGSVWNSTGNSIISSLTLNDSSLIIGNNSSADNTVTITGNYSANNGHLFFDSVLGNDSSPSDKLIINGDSSGESLVSVNNVGGKGDKTVNGIEIIHVDGQSEGVFHQDGRIVAGAYDYFLVKNGNNWYLRNLPPENMPGINPIEPGTPPESEHVNRPEGGSYIANLVAANTMFINRLHDRLGEAQYTDALTGEKKVTSLWLRQIGGHNDWRDGSGQLQTQSNSYVAQLGGDVAQWSTNGLNRGHIGLMAGYGNSHNNTHSSVTGYSSKGSVSGYSVGAYGTWFANDADKSGLYVDSWLQYSWFNNHVNGQDLAGESYKSKGLTASLETGYTLKMSEFSGSKGTLNEWFIQPQAQATWMGVKADQHREENGTVVNSDGDGNLQTRLGMRTYLKSHHAIDNGKDREFEPFVETNWIHNTKAFSATMDGDRISQAGAKNIGEIKVGVEGQLNNNLNLWGNIGEQIGDKGYNNATAMIGVKYMFK